MIKRTIIDACIFMQLLNPRKVYNYFKYGVWGDGIKLEASSACQLRCPSCATVAPKGKSVFEKTVGKGFLKFDDFKKIIDANPWIKTVEISNWGEIFLNPELQQIIEYGNKKRVLLAANNGVNLNRISEEQIECLVKNKFKHLTVSIDGASNETYQIYRKGGNFDVVIANIKKINHYKQKYNTRFPTLNWQFVIFGHNEHELPIARQMAKELNMKFIPKLNSQAPWNPDYSPVKNKEFVRKQSGFRTASRQEFEQKEKRNYNQPCNQIWFAPQVNWDGKLLGCCHNIYADFGNVFEQGLSNLLKRGEKYQYAKKMLAGKVSPRKDIACSSCHRYKYRSIPKLFKWMAGK